MLEAIAGVERQPLPGGPLARPFGVAAGPDGSFVVADPDGPAVLRVRGGRAEPVDCRGRAWSAPMAVAALGDALLVADGGAGEVVRVAADGSCRALGSGQLERPTGVAAGPDRVYVADPPRHEVVELSPSGEVLARWGTLGDRDGQLHFPTAIAAAPSGELLVVDALNFRVVRYAPGGRRLGAFGARGETGGAFARPKGIAADGAGRIYVSDAQRDLVLVFSGTGEFEAALGASGSGPGELLLPAGVAVSGDRLLVADSHNHRVQVFEILGDRP